MGCFRNNLLVEFSVVSLSIMAILAVVISVILSTRLDGAVELLEDHGAAMMAGQTIEDEDRFSIPSLRGDVKDLRWITAGAVGGGFVILYASLVLLIWRGWRTIQRQRSIIEVHATQQVYALNRLLQDRINVLFDDVKTALCSAANKNVSAAEASREYYQLVIQLSDLVRSE